MNKYLIVLDLDGTLMSDLTTFDKETFEYLKKLNSEGHKIMIATGRPKRSSYFVYQLLELHTPLINYNGALVQNPTDDNFPTTDIRINRDDLLEIIEHNRKYIINVFCEIHDDIYVQEYNSDIHDFLHVDGGIIHSGEIKDILPDNPNGALFFFESSHINEFENYIKNEYHGNLFTRYWSIGPNHIVEVYNKLVDKKNGIQDAIEYYHIDKRNTIAIGDGHNDVGMLNSVAIKVAMKNAHPDLLKVADYVTDDVYHNGVLKFLKNFFENNK